MRSSPTRRRLLRRSILCIPSHARPEMTLEGIQSLPPDADLDARLIVDVRRAKEASDHPLPERGTRNVPFEEFRMICDQVPKDKDVVCICSRGCVLQRRRASSRRGAAPTSNMSAAAH